MRFTHLPLVAALTLIAPAASRGAVIAAQDFNALDATATVTFDSLPSGSELTNASSKNTNAALGMTFGTTWTDTRGVGAGPVTPTADTSDFIGANSFSGANAPNVGPTGVAVAAGVEQNFEFNDGDGLLALTFDPIDTTGFTNLSLSLAYWINSTGFEADDLFRVRVSGSGGDFALLSFGETDLEGSASADDGTNNWRTLTADLSALGLSGAFTLFVEVDTNAADENIFIDAVSFSGDRVAAVPEPSTLALAGIGALALLSYAHRRR